MLSLKVMLVNKLFTSIKLAGNFVDAMRRCLGLKQEGHSHLPYADGVTLGHF